MNYIPTRTLPLALRALTYLRIGLLRLEIWSAESWCEECFSAGIHDSKSLRATLRHINDLRADLAALKGSL